MSDQPVLILDCFLDDFGCPAAFAPPADRAHVFVRPGHMPVEQIPQQASRFSAIVITGSSASVLDDTPWSLAVEALVADAYAARVPLFGICYGHQLIAKKLFQAAVRAEVPEIGWYDIRLCEAGRASSSLLRAAPPEFRCFLTHFDEVRDPGVDNFVVLASSDACSVQAFMLTDAPVFGVQFHAEFSRVEALQLFDQHLNETPGLISNPSGMRALATDGLPLWRDIYGKFLALE